MMIIKQIVKMQWLAVVVALVLFFIIQQFLFQTHILTFGRSIWTTALLLGALYYCDNKQNGIHEPSDFIRAATGAAMFCIAGTVVSLALADKMGSWSLILLVTGAMSGGLFFASAIDQFRFVFFCERESAPWDDFVKIIGMAIGQIIVTILVITAYYLF